jgi:hypothetical protein
MPKGFLPNSDRGLLLWANNFAQKINDSPSEVGLSVEQCEAFQAVADSYAQALKWAITPATRTRPAVQRKNDCREELRSAARALAPIIQAHPGVNDGMRISLGLTVRARKGSPIGKPQTAPTLEVLAAQNRRVRIRLRNLDPEGSRCKPANVIGATILMCVSEQFPSDLAAWSFARNTTKSRLDIRLPGSVPAGARVWLVARWLSAKLQHGPACTPVSTNLQGGVSGPLALAA